MTSGSRLTLLWLIGSAIAFALALLTLSASHVDGAFIPVGNDSFYHARRMLDAIPDLSHFYEFDAQIHAPDGSVVVWPWAYDLSMAAIAKAVLATGLAHDPMLVLALIPPLAVLVSIALLIAITRRLGLSAIASALVVLSVAISPLTQMLHGFGILDHHFAEYIFWLASIWALLRWLDEQSTQFDAVMAGALLGIAPAFHSDMFVAQLPLVGALLLWNLRGRTTQLRHAVGFGVTLALATLAVAAPSLPTREWHFEFFDLSWFQVYAAAATGTLCVWLGSSAQAVRPRFVTLAVLLLLALPGLTQLRPASNFVAGGLEFLSGIAEAKSPFAMAAEPNGFWRVSGYYSLLVWLAPAVLAGCIVEAWRASAIARTCFWMACAFGLVLLMAQFRFHYFGSIGLIVPLVIWAERAAHGLAERARPAMLMFGLAVALAYVPALRHQLFVPLSPADDFDYGLTRGLYAPFAAACRARPGIALASGNDGHYIRFKTDCSVIANNFIVTRQHVEKLFEVQQLLALSPQELAARHTQIRYVFVHLQNLFSGDGPRATAIPLDQVAAANPRLVRELILTEPADLPREFRLLHELKFQGAGGHPYARLFELTSNSDH